MATYVVGDIHGCFRTFSRLLETIGFSEDWDRLWLVGDLVNRGPDSLGMLRWAYQHCHCLRIVLGNHDLHLIGRALGSVRSGSKDTLDPILEAPDADELIDWLASQPLLFSSDGWVVVHAGILPAWSIETAFDYAHIGSSWLEGEASSDLLSDIRSSDLPPWNPSLDLRNKARWGLQILTQIRMCPSPDQVDLNYSGPPDEAPEQICPWYEFSEIRSLPNRFIFGHWSRLGRYETEQVLCLDSGCVHSGVLTAFSIDTETFITQENLESLT